MAVALDLIPFATCKIRHEDRFAAIFDGSCRQVTDAGPLGRIINIHVKRLAVPEAPYQTVIHDEIHAAMSADRFRLLLNILDNRALILLQKFLIDISGNEIMR